MGSWIKVMVVRGWVLMCSVGTHYIFVRTLCRTFSVVFFSQIDLSVSAC